MIAEEPLRPSILCPTCGLKFTPTLSNICPNCTISKTDVTMGITKQSVLTFCRFCRRYLRPPWVLCERESRQLLAICLRKIKGLNKVKLISAGFIWTEPHSKRIKVKLTISKELSNLSSIEQTFLVEFVEAYTQCEDCKKEFTPHTWGAVVQVRQHVEHKKTFYYLEQLILKHGALDKVLNVQQQDDGINFYYKNTTHAQRLIDFLSGYLPITVKTSKQLISHDESSNIFTYKYGFSVSIPRICKDDLVLITKKMATVLGGCSQLLLCLKVGTMINLLDLSSFKVVSMNAQQYQHYDKDIQLLPLKTYSSKFSVLDCTSTDPYKKKSKLSSKGEPQQPLYTTLPIYDAIVAQEGNWETVHIRTHLDLSVGQDVDAFDLRTMNFTDDLSDFKGVQDVVLVKKTRPPHRRFGFKLRRLEQEGVMVEQRPKKKKQEDKDQKEFEEFMEELVEDKDAVKNVNLYKDTEALKEMGEKEAKEALGEIDLCQLLEELKINDNAAPNTYQNDMEGIQELVAKMAKVTIEKPQDKKQ